MKYKYWAVVALRAIIMGPPIAIFLITRPTSEWVLGVLKWLSDALPDPWKYRYV